MSLESLDTKTLVNRQILGIKKKKSEQPYGNDNIGGWSGVASPNTLIKSNGWSIMNEEELYGTQVSKLNKAVSHPRKKMTSKA